MDHSSFHYGINYRVRKQTIGEMAGDDRTGRPRACLISSLFPYEAQSQYCSGFTVEIY